jgi:ankyrin repeat protein
VAKHDAREINLNHHDTKQVISIINFVSQGPDLKKIVNEMDNGGNIPLHFASMNGFSEIILHLLKDSAADTTLINEEGKMVLDNAFSLNNFFHMV